MAGHVAVGLYPRQGKATLGYILEHADIHHIFVGPSLMAGDADELVACLPADIDSIGLPYPGVPVTTRSWSDFIAGARQSVVWGKSVSVRVDLGGGRIITKKKK